MVSGPTGTLRGEGSDRPDWAVRQRDPRLFDVSSSFACQHAPVRWEFLCERLDEHSPDRFCQEIVADIEMNTPRAAIRAGYANPAYGWKLMRKQKIKDRINELRAERKERLKADADDVLQKLVQLANTNIVDFLQWDGGMLDFEDSKNISRSKLYAVKKVKQTIRGVGRNQIETFSIELEDKQKPLALLMRHLGLDSSLAATDPLEFANKLRQLSEELQAAVPGGEI